MTSELGKPRAAPALPAEVEDALIDMFAKLQLLMPTMNQDLAHEAMRAVRRRPIASLRSEAAVEFARGFAERHMFFNVAAFMTEFTEWLGLARAERRGSVEQTAEQILQWRRDAAAAIRERRLTDRLIKKAPPALLRELADQVLEHESRDVAEFLKAPGFLVRPAWRGMVASALRARGFKP